MITVGRETPSCRATWLLLAPAAAPNTEQTKEETDDLRQLEVERLDALNLAFWQEAMAGDVQAARLILRVVEQRSRLLGLESPRPG